MTRRNCPRSGGHGGSMMGVVCWYVVLCCERSHLWPSGHGNTRAVVVAVGGHCPFSATAACKRENTVAEESWHACCSAQTGRGLQRHAIRLSLRKTKSRFPPRHSIRRRRNNSQCTRAEKPRRTSLVRITTACHPPRIPCVLPENVQEWRALV